MAGKEKQPLLFNEELLFEWTPGNLILEEEINRERVEQIHRGDVNEQAPNDELNNDVEHNNNQHLNLPDGVHQISDDEGDNNDYNPELDINKANP